MAKIDRLPAIIVWWAGYAAALRAATRSTIAFLPSSKYISVLSAANSGFGMPAKPGDRLRLMTTTVRASPTLRIGIPAIGLLGSVLASGFTTSLAPITITTSVWANVGL